jgi:ankyrin repeat protein
MPFHAVTVVSVALLASGLWAQEKPMGVKIAFLGDQGTAEGDGEDRERAPEVLQLVKAEGAHAVVHQGDFDYDHNPDAWDALIDDVLGKDFSYFGSAGNHDVRMWDAYQKKLEDRARRIGIAWDGRMDVNARARNGTTALLAAAPAESPSGVVAALLELGARSDARDESGRTPLLIAAAEGNRPDVIALARRSDVNARDREGHTALMLVVYKAEAAEAVKALIAAGADVNAANGEGRTALMCAADGGSPDVVRQLLAAGASVEARDDLGRTALMWGAHGRSAPTETAHMEILDALLKAGADRSAADKEGRSAATYARYGGYDQALPTLATTK